MKSILVLSLLLDVAGVGSMVMAQSPGTFTATGNMSTERMGHTATLLTNGKVLIAGGGAIVSSGVPARATAELYDPATGAFTNTGDMTTARAGHTATLQPNGMVLIAGGNALSSAELYDPSTGTFTASGEMTTPRGSFTATLLNNGKVLIAGGEYPRITNGPCCNLAKADLYDPSTGTFTATGDMTTDRQGHKSTLLSNGKVLIQGGYGSGRDNDRPGGNELYDPDTGTFSLTAGRVYPDLYPVTATLLTNGKILVTSMYCCDASDLAEVYDPSAGTSTATGNMTKPRGYSTATLLPDGRVLIAGREWVHSGGSADLYDPVTGTFSTTGDMLTQREEGHTATLLPDGSVLLAGGWICCEYTTLATAEIYHPAAMAPSPLLFSLSGDGKGPGAILHSGTNQVVSPGNPAVAGEVLEIYLTGLTDGGVIPPQVAIGGRMAQVLFYGKAPGFAGLNQVNVRVPSGVEPGPAVPVRLTYISRPSNEVTISVH